MQIAKYLSIGKNTLIIWPASGLLRTTSSTLSSATCWLGAGQVEPFKNKWGHSHIVCVICQPNWDSLNSVVEFFGHESPWSRFLLNNQKNTFSYSLNFKFKNHLILSDFSGKIYSMLIHVQKIPPLSSGYPN